MPLTLNLTNFSSNNVLEKAEAAKDAAPNQPVLILDNAQNFQTDDFILVGKRGGSVSKIMQVLSVSNNTLTLSQNFNTYIERGTQITKLFGDSLNVYRAPYTTSQLPDDSAYSVVNTTPLPIDPDQLTTSFTDTTGSSAYWYKYTFYNSSKLAETYLNSSRAVRDTTDTDYANIADVRREAGFEDNANVTDELIYRKLQAAQSKINGMLSGRYVLPLGQPVNPIMADLTVRLAAGYVMIAEYGAFDGQDKSKGEKLRDDAITELTAYQDGSQVITDLQAISVELPDAGGFESGYSSDNPLGFSREDIVGYNARIY